ncbi:MAG: ribulose-phosphate 3-epimerase [Actinomycetota bacterium]
MTHKLAPSILAADFAHLADHVAAVEKHSDLLHVDVMDGHFVPPITIGPVVVKALRRVTSLPLECHLMVTKPEEQSEQFAEAGATSVVWHLEAAPDPRPVLQRARALGMKAGLAINPETAFETTIPFLEEIDVLNIMTVNPGWAGQAFLRGVLPKIRAARDYVESRGLMLDISVDGGVNMETARLCLDAGANVLGAATAIFGRPDAGAAAEELRQLMAGFEGADR